MYLIGSKRFIYSCAFVYIFKASISIPCGIINNEYGTKLGDDVT